MKAWFDRGAWVSKRGLNVIAQLTPDHIKHIVVVRHAALGDMVLVRPFLIEARKFFPNAKITLNVVSNYNYGVPSDLVDAVHVMYGDDIRGVSLSDQIKKVKELKEVDLLFDFADTTRSRYLCLLTEAKLKIGFPYRQSMRTLLFDAAVFRSDFVFEAENMLHALELLGANPSRPLNYALGLSTELDRRASQTRPYIVYFPFASHVKKCWPAQQFRELVKTASMRFPEYDHYLLQGTSSWEGLDEFESLLHDSNNIKLQKTLPLEQAQIFLRDAYLVVCNDTGIRNLAISLGTPTLGIFFQTVPYRYWPRNGCHDIVFNYDGALPSVNSVIERQADLVKQVALAGKKGARDSGV